MGALSTGAVGQGDYIVKPGDCLSSIAHRFGYSWETIWNDPQNNDLKTLRKDPNVLLSGDRIYLPELRAKHESCSVDSIHTFVLSNVPSKLRLQFFSEEQPRSHEKYRIEVDGQAVSSGTLDKEGRLEASILPSSQKARVFVGEGASFTPYEFMLGHIDPITEIAGIQQRLRNLGFLCEETGELDDETTQAISQFQQSQDMKVTGELDNCTRDKLQSVHGC